MKEPHSPHPSLPKVTFIIPTLNAASILPRCLSAIRSQNYPQKLIEIIISDGGSVDTTKNVAKQFDARVMNNPEVLHEHGKSRASGQASGRILFFTDADNVLASNDWVLKMVRPYIEHPNVKGFLPQTTPAPDSNILDQYLGYLFTDPLTWFIYGEQANPATYEHVYIPVVKEVEYTIFKFPTNNYPLFGLSQGVGVTSDMKRNGIGYSDDLLAGIQLMQSGGLVAYVPTAGVYHYHVNDLRNFIEKYRWRMRNNLTQKVQGMGLRNRMPYLNRTKKLRMYLFPFYSLSLIFPALNGIQLSIKHKTHILLIHPFVCLVMTSIIAVELFRKVFISQNELGEYK